MTTYLEKAQTLLTNDSQFVKVNLTMDEWEREARTVIQKLCFGTLEKELYTAVLPGENRFPELYGLPKDHKNAVPLRPVVSACDSPVTKVSILLGRILHQCLQFVPAHLENTVEALEAIKSCYPDPRAPHGSTLVTLNVVALYPSIPIDAGVEAVIRMLQKHHRLINTFSLGINDIRDLLTYEGKANYFRFGTQIYHQRDGVAMGNNLAPPFAIYIYSTCMIWNRACLRAPLVTRHCSSAISTTY